MLTRLRHFRTLVAETFWVVPAAVVVAAGLLAVACVQLDRSGVVPDALLDSAWLYNGGATGARTLLGAVAASAIGVAGTVFSITIAALTLAAGQMGPRLLRNFVRDRGNQVTLGMLLGTFTYALMVLRSVRANEEGGGFTPHLSMSVGIALALLSVAMLIYFVGHIAGRINVDTVIGLVGGDLRQALRAVKAEDNESPEPLRQDWSDAVPVSCPASGYLQQLDTRSLSRWAEEQGAQVQLLVRPGHHVFPGATVARVRPETSGSVEAIRDALLLGSERTSDSDLEYAIRQLVEVAMRALSPSINDPYTAVSVIDRLGTALCEIVAVRLPSGQYLGNGKLVLEVPTFDYDGLADAMFHPLRQSAAGNVLVLIRLLEVLQVVAGCEPDVARRATLRRHADLVMEDGARTIANHADLADLRQRHLAFGG